ncbi:hypothetical protein HWV62_18490 [Athelia sp. TMB]|nr:hypothetical protein HWV62_18490 [Athelia sp. TMB]
MKMSARTFTFNGREYPADAMMKEVVAMAKMLADNARITNPLPAGVDLTGQEQKEIQDQINAMAVLPKPATDMFWTAFAANHLAALGSAMRALSHDSQPRALARYIQILSLLLDPKDDPYFRRFLQHPTQSKDVANIVASAFVKGIEWIRPSGPELIATLMIHLLFWVDPKTGDDGRGSIDAPNRGPLQAKLAAILESPSIKRLDLPQRVDLERLAGILGCMASEEVGSYYIQSTQDYLQRDLDACGKWDCEEEDEPELRCSKCKTVKYCGKAHQGWHWKNGHKLKCFAPVD